MQIPVITKAIISPKETAPTTTVTEIVITWSALFATGKQLKVIYIHMCIHAYFIYIYTYIHTLYILTYIHTYIHAYEHTCMHYS